MRFRQVHLDFHTHADIPGIGEKFDAKAFARSLREAYVDSVTVFSKCHHGLSYHPTKVGKMHPHLEFNLLRAQMDALHAEGIKAPVYLTASWDELAAFEHPEWRTVLPDNSFAMFRAPDGNGVGWAFLQPILAAAIFALFLGRAVGLMSGLKRHMATVERVIGALLVAVGLLMLTGGFSTLSFWLIDTFPALLRVG